MINSQCNSTSVYSVKYSEYGVQVLHLVQYCVCHTVPASTRYSTLYILVGQVEVRPSFNPDLSFLPEDDQQKAESFGQLQLVR